MDELSAKSDFALPIEEIHTPVMIDRIVELLSPALQESSVYVDATLGMGGHAERILQANPQARLLGIDRDAAAIALAKHRLAPFGERVTIVQARFDELPNILRRLKLDSVQAILADFGLSSLQIDDVGRGFSYSVDAPLDMRMDRRQDLTAADIVNDFEADELVRLFRTLGDETQAPRIVRAIVAEREKRRIESSAELVEIITNSLPAAIRHGGRGHPAKRVFQALRIAVNLELEAVEAFITGALDHLAVGGRLALLSYHSGEDRLAKSALARATSHSAPPGLPVIPESMKAKFVPLTRGAEKPSEVEINHNPRAASARLRAVERIGEDQ